MRTVIHLARSGIVLTLLLLISVAGNFYQYYRRPDRIVVDKSSGRVVEINDRDYGETEVVELGPEHLTDADKKYIASEFVRSLYKIDPATRSKDIERALRMMLPDSALKFARYLKQDSILDRQLQESWQSTWTAQDITVDSKDHYTVRVLGRQVIHRLDNGVTLDEPRQLSPSLKLIADPKGRADAISAQASLSPALITRKSSRPERRSYALRQGRNYSDSSSSHCFSYTGAFTETEASKRKQAAEAQPHAGLRTA